MFTEPRLGYGLYLCNNDLDNVDIRRGMYHRDDYLINRIAPENFSDIYEIDKNLKDQTIIYMISNHKKLIVPIFNRILNFWSYKPNPYNQKFSFTDRLMFLFWLPIFAFYVTSVFCIREKKYFIIDILVLFSMVSVIPFWGTPRFRYPLDFMIILKSMYMFKKLFLFYKNRIQF